MGFDSRHENAIGEVEQGREQTPRTSPNRAPSLTSPLCVMRVGRCGLVPEAPPSFPKISRGAVVPPLFPLPSLRVAAPDTSFESLRDWEPAVGAAEESAL